MEEIKFTTYNVTQKYGMEGIGDMELDWLTPEEQESRWNEYRKYVEETKKDGRYGKEYQTNISIESDPTLDYPSEAAYTSFSMQIIDFSEDD